MSPRIVTASAQVRARKRALTAWRLPSSQDQRVRTHLGAGRERRRTARPAAERQDRRLELAPPLRQLVDLGRRGWRQLAAADDPGLLQLAQSLAENVRADVGDAGAEVGEALRPEEELPDDEQRPSLSQQVGGVGDAATVELRPRARHGGRV
jgi:hypothetical protein